MKLHELNQFRVLILIVCNHLVFAVPPLSPGFQLYLLDLRKESPLSWMSVPITGVTPGRRYGHSMAYHKISEGHHRANLIVFGGNDGYVRHA